MPPSPDIEYEIGAIVSFSFPTVEDVTANARIVGLNGDEVTITPPHPNAQVEDPPGDTMKVQVIPLSQFKHLVEVYSAPGLE